MGRLKPDIEGKFPKGIKFDNMPQTTRRAQSLFLGSSIPPPPMVSFIPSSRPLRRSLANSTFNWRQGVFILFIGFNYYLYAEAQFRYWFCCSFVRLANSKNAHIGSSPRPWHILCCHNYLMNILFRILYTLPCHSQKYDLMEQQNWRCGMETIFVGRGRARRSGQRLWNSS